LTRKDARVQGYYQKKRKEMHEDGTKGKGRHARTVPEEREGGCKYSSEEREGDSKKSERGAGTIPEQRESFKYITQEGKGMKDSIKKKGG
jgi:hypothetical protein